MASLVSQMTEMLGQVAVTVLLPSQATVAFFFKSFHHRSRESEWNHYEIQDS